MKYNFREALTNKIICFKKHDICPRNILAQRMASYWSENWKAQIKKITLTMKIEFEKG